MNISVCICTFRRPALLAALLDAVGQQNLGTLHAQVELIVVDNDPAHSARPVLQAWAAPAGFSLHFVHVPEANISIARNTAVNKATGEWIALIDDDETPATDWLLRLVETQHRFNADAVFAPVVPRYLPGTPAWLQAGGYFDRTRFATGTPIDDRDARTGNVLIRAARLKTIPGPFDVAFGRTGGEDSLLFRDLQAQGCTFVWCDEAPVSEDVPLERANARWLLRRSFRVGQTWIRTELHRMPAPVKRVRGFVLTVRSAIQLIASVALLVCIWPVSRTKSFHWARIAMMQVGRLTGMTRFQYKEYGA